ncbi:hypothetical protein [Natronorubrum sulfidifaciens]|uniref:Uncharacterized protein n=1 Tax=Natronorubrum sulfidifaciens JCM 14089 TaxID=1230460 RepID=L9WDS8_9EURY|nr:hypothetical protein [Natronorubrum sulfidifaciens]ELY47614.1 hypothetical protein C495_05132 [Natronorubrum sulfidifaciens JCM 14089]
MCANFTEDDIGKPVERTDGKVIGTVQSVDTATAHVEPTPDVVDLLKVRFSGAEIGGPFILHEPDVRDISETRVHLADGFSKANAPTPAGEPTAQPDAESEPAGASGSAGAQRADADADAGGIGPFNTPFQIGSAVVAGLSFLIAVVFLWTGYQESELLLVGPELDIISGTAGLMLAAFVGTVALIAAVYMEPGFDH